MPWLAERRSPAGVSGAFVAGSRPSLSSSSRSGRCALRVLVHRAGERSIRGARPPSRARRERRERGASPNDLGERQGRRPVCAHGAISRVGHSISQNPPSQTVRSGSARVEGRPRVLVASHDRRHHSPSPPPSCARHSSTRSTVPPASSDSGAGTRTPLPTTPPPARPLRVELVRLHGRALA